jgi:hypothetical protein
MVVGCEDAWVGVEDFLWSLLQRRLLRLRVRLIEKERTDCWIARKSNVDDLGELFLMRRCDLGEVKGLGCQDENREQNKQV